MPVVYLLSFIQLSNSAFVIPTRYKILLLLSLAAVPACAQMVDLSGIVKNNEGEALPWANVVLLPDSAIATTEADGTFAFQTRAAKKHIAVSYTGYETIRMAIELRADTMLTIT